MYDFLLDERKKKTRLIDVCNLSELWAHKEQEYVMVRAMQKKQPVGGNTGLTRQVWLHTIFSPSKQYFIVTTKPLLMGFLFDEENNKML